MEIPPQRFRQLPVKLIGAILKSPEEYFKPKIISILRKVRSIGRNETMEEYEQQKLAIFNQLNFLQLLSGIVIPLIGLFAHRQIPATAWLIAFLPPLVSVLVLILNTKHKHESALLAYFVLYPFVTCLVYLYGMNLGIGLSFILYGILSVFFIRDIGYMIFSLCFSMVNYFLLSVVLKQYQYQLHELNYGLYLFNQGLAIILIFYGLFLIKRENAGYQARILAKNKVLNEKNIHIQMQANLLRDNASLLENQAAELVELNHVKNKLFSVISHDLKAPMYALRNLFANVQANNMSATELKKTVPDVIKDLNFTVGLMENLLQWAKTQMQTDKAYPQEINIASSIQEVLQLLRLQANAKQIRIKSLVKSEIFGYMDRDMLQLVLRNLISNAIKFTPRKGNIAIGVVEHTEFIEVFVQDSGSGISPEALEKINSNDFYTSKGTASESGTGLGLMLCKEFIARNGGQLHIESEKGKGSIFSFSLPITG